MSKKNKWFGYHLKAHHWSNGEKDHVFVERVVTEGVRPDNFHRFIVDVNVQVPLTNAAGRMVRGPGGSIAAREKSSTVPIPAKDVSEAYKKLLSIIDKESKRLEAEVKAGIEKDKLWTPDQKPLVTP